MDLTLIKHLRILELEIPVVDVSAACSCNGAYDEASEFSCGLRIDMWNKADDLNEGKRHAGRSYYQLQYELLRAGNI